MTDWMPELSDDDLTTMIEALEAWENKDAAGEMLGDVFEAMISKDVAADAKAKLVAERSDARLKRERERAVRKERSIILRAKLLMLRERRRVELATSAR